MKKKASTKVLLTVFVLLVVFMMPTLVYANTDPSLAKVLIGNWQYFFSNSAMGTIRFDGLNAGSIYDNRYGSGTFTGKFVTSNVFEGIAYLPRANTTKTNLVIDFYHPQNDPTGWSFKGWVFDYSNGSFARGQKL